MKRLPKGTKAQIMGTRLFQTMYTADQMRKAVADEREALKAEDWTTIMREGSLVTWLDAEELGERVRAVIRARVTK